MSPAHGPEFRLVEAPCIRELLALGYRYLPPFDPKERFHNLDSSLIHPGDNETARDGLNQVLLRDEVQAAIVRINGVPLEVARATYAELLGVRDNELWTQRLRGNLSRNVPDQSTKKTIHLIDFLHPENNSFLVTNQLYIQAEKSGRPDLVVYINGIPLVVIEAKSPVAAKDKSGQAFDQIKRYEQDLPRLFYSNLFNVVTDGLNTLYGTTGAPSPAWSAWRDPWPRTTGDFPSALAKDFWCLFEPARLLDLLAHFVVFERKDEKVTKKLCRYHQFRAVQKIVDRVAGGQQKKGLVWHTQGSGKSLTMVFAALKLKTHRTVEALTLRNPHLLVVTDRKQLDKQISDTFAACALPNPMRMTLMDTLRKALHSSAQGKTLLTTLHKFAGSKTALSESADWIVLVDEAHRSQEEDLGAYLRATLPEARLFGFTGTPVKKNDKDTYANFGEPGEGYLDRYSIDDAVADGATVPIRYTSRKTEWQIDPAKLDILFDQWFAEQPEEWIAEVRRRGVTIADLAKHQQRVDLIAYDLWTHFRTHIRPDRGKAQIVAIDREAAILYKRALDGVIAAWLEKEEKLSFEAARAKAATFSAPVYSASQEDAKPSEDPFVASIRPDLVRYHLDEEGEKIALASFQNPEHDLSFLIVCDKLITGFDAPIEAVMYLDRPLRDHTLLQAIARTNRTYEGKKYGLIVDYIGVTRSLGEALASYREADVINALRDLVELEGELRAAHRAVMELVQGVARGTGNLKAEYDALVALLRDREDAWLTFQRKARAFIHAYEALAPDPAILEYTQDLKWVATFLPYARREIEKRVHFDLPDFSAKIRELLEEHLRVTGLRDLLKLRKITDPDYWHDFRTEGKSGAELREAAIRKLTELKAITAEKAIENPLRYERFSERVLALIQQMEQNLLDAKSILTETEAVSHDLQAETRAHEATGLSERAYGVYTILDAFRSTGGQPGEVAQPQAEGIRSGILKRFDLLKLTAEQIDGLYTSDASAPAGWHLKEEMRKELRQQVRALAHEAKLTDLMAVPARVEEFALRHYARPLPL